MGSRAKSLPESSDFALEDLSFWRFGGREPPLAPCHRGSLLWQGCFASGFLRDGVSLSPCYPYQQPSSSSCRPGRFHMSSQRRDIVTQEMAKRPVGTQGSPPPPLATQETYIGSSTLPRRIYSTQSSIPWI